MKPEDVVELLEEQRANTDTEEAHRIADLVVVDFLDSLGYHAIVEAWRKVHKWYA